MRAILIATGCSTGADAISERIPAPLVPLVDRPFVQHVVEFLVRRGVVQFDFVLSDAPEEIESLLGEGERWGVRFTYHLAADPTRPYGLLHTADLGSNGDAALLLGHADRLPQLPLAPSRKGGRLPTLYFWDDDADAGRGRTWTGWASLRPRHLRGLRPEATEMDLRAHLAKAVAREGEWCEVGRPLGVQTSRDVIAAHRAVLCGEFPGLSVAAREKGPSGWFARNAKVHSTARVFPPVYVGENSVVGAGVQLGPQAVVGRDCVLDVNCRVANAVVLSDSYVGQMLDLSDVIVAGDRLIDGRAGTAVTVRDPAILADLAAPCMNAAFSTLERVSALLMLSLASPVLLSIALWLWARGRGLALHRRPVLRLPAPADPAAWRTFCLWSFTPHEVKADEPDGGPPCTLGGLLLRVLPALVNVVRGDLGLVGVPARGPEEVEALPADWREVYLSGRAGVVTEAAVRGADRGTPDELYAAEAFSVGLSNRRRKLMMLGGYFARCLFGYAPRRAGSAAGLPPSLERIMDMSAPRRLPPAFFSGLIVLCLTGCGPPQQEAERPPSPAAADGPRLGVNLAPVTDYTREWAFVDVFKASRPWYVERGGRVALDDDGNPLPTPDLPTATLIARELGGHYPGGLYVATYAGTGTIDLSRYDVTEVVKKAPGRVEATVKPGDDGVQLVVAESDPKDPARDFHVWTPGFEGSESAFHPLFRERLKAFRVLRFMDWQRTNNSKLRQWSERAKPADSRYTTEAGVPLEVMIDLANACDASPWFCIPHQADDVFVTKFAETVKARLKPDLNVHVEYSNEVWNGQFAQSRWAQEQGERLRLGKPENLRFYARRSVEIFKVWETVFGGRDRLVRVLGSHFANPWVSEQVLTWDDAGKRADALAVAPYFGVHFGSPDAANEVAKKSVGELLNDLDVEVSGENRELMCKQAAVAAKYGVSLAAYEGGQHLAGFNGAENNEALAKLFIAANRDPRMYNLYAKHLANWADAGGGLYAAYNNVSRPTKWGSWGALEFQDQPIEDAPKYRALLSFAARTAPSR